MIHNQTPEQIATTFEAAAELIRTNGLCKHQYWPGAFNPDFSHGVNYQPGMPTCAIGALSVTQGLLQPGEVERWAPTPAHELCETTIDASLHHWNDDRTTTADEVIEKFLGIAKDLRNGKIVP